MDTADALPQPESRPPTIDDLISLCKNLNEARARYMVIGGMAIIHAGFLRATEDIDLLIEDTAENQVRVRSALGKLPDNAVSQMADDDLKNYIVVRIADEIVVDLLVKAGGIDFDTAKGEIVVKRVGGVDIPFASAELLYKMKQTLREKDKQDLIFLQRLLHKG
jgi:hypothetical protein